MHAMTPSEPTQPVTAIPTAGAVKARGCPLDTQYPVGGGKLPRRRGAGAARLVAAPPVAKVNNFNGIGPGYEGLVGKRR